MRGVGRANFAVAARLGARLGVEVNANETMSPQRFYEDYCYSGAV
jgi:hypothetical protein